MRKAIAAFVVGLSLLSAGTASAIVFGQPDGDGHPNVGALLAPQAYSDGTWASCSGTPSHPRSFSPPHIATGV
jgi:hypothetical protein